MQSKMKVKVEELNNMLLLKLICESTFLEKYKQLIKNIVAYFLNFCTESSVLICLVSVRIHSLSTMKMNKDVQHIDARRGCEKALG